MIIRRISQILPNVPVEQQVHIVHRGIIHQPIQFAGRVHISFSTLVQSMEIILPSAYFTSTQAVSTLNSQEICLSMLSSQKQK